MVGGGEVVEVAREDGAVRVPRARDEQVAAVLDGPAEARHVRQLPLQHDLQVRLAALHATRHTTQRSISEFKFEDSHTWIWGAHM